VLADIAISLLMAEIWRRHGRLWEFATGAGGGLIRERADEDFGGGGVRSTSRMGGEGAGGFGGNGGKEGGLDTHPVHRQPGDIPTPTLRSGPRATPPRFSRRQEWGREGLDRGWRMVDIFEVDV